MVDKLTKVANIVWHFVTVPDEWKRGAIERLLKKVNLCDCDHWKGITLLIIARKMLFLSPTEMIS